MKCLQVVTLVGVLLIVTSIGACGQSSPLVSVSPPLSPPPSIPCAINLLWKLPTARPPDNYGQIQTLDPTEIDFGTLSLGMIPLAPEEELVYINKVEAHMLQYQILDNPPGEYYFRLTVTDTEGRESAYSNEVSKTCL